MSIKNESAAGWAVHPGEILREEFLEPMNISAYKLSVELRVSPPTVNDIVREKRGITPEMATRLARYFGAPSSSGLICRTPLPYIKQGKVRPRNSKRSSPPRCCCVPLAVGLRPRRNPIRQGSPPTQYDRTLQA
jgi:addiction module HigA family antidote